MNKLGVAVIGTGFWGKNHARVYRELENTDLIAICDVNPERAKTIAEQYGAKAYTNSLDMLKDPEIQAVSVCTWSTKLAEESLKCLNAGKHVLVEKPMATDTKQAQTLIDTARANDLCLSVGFLMRFIPGIQQIRQAVETKKIGELVSATAKRVAQWPERIGDVGVVKDTAIHDIDVMYFISGEKPVSVYAKMGNMRHRQFEDYAQIMLTYESGKTAFIEANWLTPYKIRALNVTGSEAIIRLDYNSQELWIENATETVQPRSSFKEPLKTELEHFTECIIEKQTPIITGEDGYNALEIAMAAMESSAKNAVIKLGK
ncbi:MAG: Gfo/Idh/MocA family oxidoreductase [Nitrososphaerota archaeon]|uniref:Gfo/Idh/MocA family protein n=1 Tax=Candidatus Bathycorpusculum sp. TaxID=2994959 RepID=UPI002834B10D|nr:Gfo/Idh/MocA family oxidoreductase [Candidatus Termiticorpusculum sp.]MCL2257798.1 Gfo/Idh/MocA family oxidoreductase [Candidatus Termiticorpusculum sp.]MCL2291475.1 Gfo/Idh/MocA family oxidoreductase [Candidatus Termiticorpusculum sp.]MDR0461494.1 Gfo/Idh/MocA family oxidoreductase [Nitrososphaerota archaeon]